MPDLVDLLTGIPGIGPLLPYIFSVFGFAAVLAAQLPPPSRPDGAYAWLWRGVNLLGQNYRHACNAKAVPAPPKADAS